MLRRLITALHLEDLYIAFRQRQIITDQQSVADLWQHKIDKLSTGALPQADLSPKRPELVGQKIIWQYWGQGASDYNQLPDLVRLCFLSVDEHKGDYTVIRLDDSSLSDYLELPPFVFDRLNEGGGYDRTLLSDLIRVGLLAIYGGIWIDATIYLSGKIPSYCFEGDCFIYSRSDEEPQWVRKIWQRSFYAYWSWNPRFMVRHLSSFIVAKPQTPLLQTIYTLLLDYWRTEQEVKLYFIFQVLIHQLTTGFLKEEPIHTHSDVVPHLLAMSLTGNNKYLQPAEVLRKTTLHKFNSKDPRVTDIIDYLCKQQKTD